MFRYSYEVRHDGLGKYRLISGTDETFVRAKATALRNTWEAEYRRKLAKQREKEDREMYRRELQGNVREAELRTKDAKDGLAQVANILHMALDSNHAVDWEKLKRKDTYSKPKPSEPVYLEFPKEPQIEDAKYQPVLTVFDKFSKTRVDEKTRIVKLLFESDHVAWLVAVEQVKAENQNRYSASVAAIEKWNAESLKHQEELDRENAAIDLRKANYESLQPDAISDYCEIILSESEYPESFPKEFDLQYVSETKVLVIDYSLPTPENLPNVKEVKYVKAKDEFHETLLSEAELNRNYDDALYQICLRTLHESFDADVVGALEAIVFNGWVESIDKATGKEIKGCVISVQAKKQEFQEINLQNVDAKACFKKLKGVGSSALHSLTPIRPVLQLNREDKRFIPSREVENQLDAGFNLAAMDWEDFEQLVREIFEKEFSKPGDQVKVTQASRDGGVDAVIFDNDDIHGGKIVIQAKRYTNTVGVGFVRELWGTVLNEGAMKGILITTADYGPDAYEFAKGKPITLLNGANLLYLLEKHGRKAKIDIREAKRILGEKIHDL